MTPHGPDWYDQNPHARWSFSRYAVYTRCPAWFRYQYIDWHKVWTTPTLVVGHAVQRALELVFDARPEDGIAIEALPARAEARLLAVFDREWQRVQAAYEADPNGYGPFDAPKERYAAYAEQGLRWHLEEVRARLERRHPRTGESLALDPVDAKGAWEAVRPWHAPPTEDFDQSMERVPAGDFQGQTDLVYTWTGGRRIVDLKASRGESLFSAEINLQLRVYAWMELELGRGRPEGLEGWFLGAEAPKVFPVPTEEEARAMGDLIRETMTSVEEAAADPQAIAAHFAPAPAEVPGRTPEPFAASAWCQFCPAAPACPKSGREGVPAAAGNESGPPSVQGIVAGIAAPRLRTRGGATRRFTLIHKEGAQSFSWPDELVRELIAKGLRAGRHVRLSGLNPWRHPASGQILYYPRADLHFELL